MPDGTYRLSSDLISLNAASGDYTLNSIGIVDEHDNESTWDINTAVTITNPNDDNIDRTPPVLNDFEIVETK